MPELCVNWPPVPLARGEARAEIPPSFFGAMTKEGSLFPHVVGECARALCRDKEKHVSLRTHKYTDNVCTRTHIVCLSVCLPVCLSVSLSLSLCVSLTLPLRAKCGVSGGRHTHTRHDKHTHTHTHTHTHRHTRHTRAKTGLRNVRCQVLSDKRQRVSKVRLESDPT